MILDVEKFTTDANWQDKNFVYLPSAQKILSQYPSSKNITKNSEAHSELVFVMCDFAVGRSCQI